jgi:hypothetical protein
MVEDAVYFSRRDDFPFKVLSDARKDALESHLVPGPDDVGSLALVIQEWRTPGCFAGLIEYLKPALNEPLAAMGRWLLQSDDRAALWHRDLLHQGNVFRRRRPLKLGRHDKGLPLVVCDPRRKLVIAQAALMKRVPPAVIEAGLGYLGGCVSSFVRTQASCWAKRAEDKKTTARSPMAVQTIRRMISLLR